ncbi:hypothetical protein [Shigella flexneri]
MSKLVQRVMGCADHERSAGFSQQAGRDINRNRRRMGISVVD